MVTPGPMQLTLPQDLADIIRARMAAGQLIDGNAAMKRWRDRQELLSAR